MRPDTFLRRQFDRFVSLFVHSASRAYYRQYFYADKWHPHYRLLEEALGETVDYIKSNMKTAMVLQDEVKVLQFASTKVNQQGLFLEFGVRTGHTINIIARSHPQATIYGFDSFEGLPEDWSGWAVQKGAFGGEGIPKVRKNVELVAGWFDDTLPGFLQQHDGDVALVHIDSDLYSSAKTIFDNLAPRIKPGCVIVFNEYFNYPNWQEHEYKAFQEFVSDYGVEYEYLCWGLYEVAVKIHSINHTSKNPAIQAD